MQQIALELVKEPLLQLIEQAAHGEEVVITKGNQPFVKLVPAIKQKKQRQFGSAKGLIEIADDFDEPLEEFQEYI